MGGLFSTYLAWEHSDFARHHAAMSPSYWITIPKGKDFMDAETVAKMRREDAPDIRMWLDSGTRTGEDYGSDGRELTVAARDALKDNGFEYGDNLGYFLHEDAMHTESAWAERLPYVFKFLFPLK